ncbi:MAG TPA: gluconate 2-dehydrogenase subunit 3 family protein [Woeseiaceae bacterium]
MDGEGLTRRGFMASSGALAGAAAFSRVGWAGIVALGQAACRARDEGAAFTALTRPEARELEAMAARILPTTDTPGAREAGVIHFFDQALGSFLGVNLPAIRGGVAELGQVIPARYAGAGAFSDLDPADQDAYLQTQEGQPFFELVRFLTLAGFLGMSEYGGNADHVGWKLLGLDPGQHGHQYPFGWYDAQVENGHSDPA